MERPVSQRIVFKGRLLTIRVDTVLTPKGHKAVREIVERPNTVSVVAVDDNGNILLVRQHRYAIGRDSMEIPAGTIDPGETPEQAARRELREETGYKPTTLIPLYTYWPAIGYCVEKMTIFLGMGLKPAPLEGDEDMIEVIRMPFVQVYNMARGGDALFEDAKSTLGVILAAPMLKKAGQI